MAHSAKRKGALPGEPEVPRRQMSREEAALMGIGIQL